MHCADPRRDWLPPGYLSPVLGGPIHRDWARVPCCAEGVSEIGGCTCPATCPHLSSQLQICYTFNALIRSLMLPSAPKTRTPEQELFRSGVGYSLCAMSLRRSGCFSLRFPRLPFADPRLTTWLSRRHDLAGRRVIAQP